MLEELLKKRNSDKIWSILWMIHLMREHDIRGVSLTPMGTLRVPKKLLSETIGYNWKRIVRDLRRSRYFNIKILRETDSLLITIGDKLGYLALGDYKNEIQHPFRTAEYMYQWHRWKEHRERIGLGFRTLEAERTEALHIGGMCSTEQEAIDIIKTAIEKRARNL